MTGASPETLVRLEDGATSSCAPSRARGARGTTPRGGRLARARAARRSERARRARHAGRPGPQRCRARRRRLGSVKVSELMSVERYSHVMHMISHVTRASSRPARTGSDVLRAAFPAGTLVGRAEDPRHGDHRRARAARSAGSTAAPSATSAYAGNARPRDRDPHAVSRWATRSTCRRAPASSPTACPTEEYQECVNKARAVLSAVAMARTAEASSMNVAASSITTTRSRTTSRSTSASLGAETSRSIATTRSRSTEIARASAAHIVISPGPCTPNEAGISLDVIRRSPARSRSSASASGIRSSGRRSAARSCARRG